MARARLQSRTRVGLFCLAALATGIATGVVRVADAQVSTLKIAVASSLSGPFEIYGRPVLNAARLAVEEANAKGGTPRITLDEYDDAGKDDSARAIARQIDATDAIAVVGPVLTTASIAAGNTYEEAGLASIVPTAHGDAVTDNATTFRTVFSTSEIGQALANYLRYALDGKNAVVIFRDNGFGRPIAKGFNAAAMRLGIAADLRGYSTVPEAEEAARGTARDRVQR